LPTGGVKQVRFNTQYTSTSPTYRDSIYIDNINIYKENPTASIEGGTDYKSIDFVKLSFTNAMTSSTLTASNITVSNVSNYTVSYDDITQTATIQFNTPLDVATNYSISFNSNVIDINGNSLTSGTLDFTTTADNPEIVSCTAPANATIGMNSITSNCGSGTTTITVNVTPRTNQTWKLYSDANCSTEIVNKVLTIAREIILVILKLRLQME
jgi:hypothetical protein